MFGLDPDTIRNIKQAVAKIPDIDKVILYGSRAKGNYRNGSDIDITLFGENLTLDNSVYPLMDELEGLNLPYMFDISIFSDIDNENLTEHINRVGKVFYQRKKGLPKGWEVKKLGEVCKISTGKSNANQAVSNGQYAFFDRSKKTKRSNRYLFDCDALIIPGEGATFFPKHYFGKFDLHQRAYAIFNFNKDVNINFIEYYLIFEHKYFERVAVGATVKSLRLRHFQELQIPLPPLPEQKRIVVILDKAFTAIAKAKANTEQNLKNAREIFQSTLQTEFANGKLKIENGEWEEKRLGEVCDVKPPKKLAKKKLLENDLVTFFPMVDLKAFNYYIKPHQTKHLKDVYQGYVYFENGDVLLAKITPCFENGKLGIASGLQNGVGFGSSEYMIFRPDINTSSAYIYYFLSLDGIRKKGKSMMTGAVGHKRIPVDYIVNQKLIIPPLPEQKRIVEKLDSISTETKKLETIYQQKINDLDELKKSILQKAFGGEL